MLTYVEAGVDIEAGAALVDRIVPFTQATRRAEVLGSLGGFGALCRLPEGYRDPLLMTVSKGLGPVETGRHQEAGLDLVARCANEVAARGAEPLFFLDYFASGHLDVDTAAQVIQGIALGCQQAGCALVGGETAEMPGMYRPPRYELVGFCAGVLERTRAEATDGSRVGPGDVVLGLAAGPFPQRCHVKALRAAHDTDQIHGCVVAPSGLTAGEAGDLLRRGVRLPIWEGRMGVVLVVAAPGAAAVRAACEVAGEEVHQLGEVAHAAG